MLYSKLMLALVHKEVIRETLTAHIEIVLDTDEAGGRLAKRLLTSSSFNTFIATFMKFEKDTMEDKKCSTAFALKERIADVETSSNHQRAVKNFGVTKQSAKSHGQAA